LVIIAIPITLTKSVATISVTPALPYTISPIAISLPVSGLHVFMLASTCLNHIKLFLLIGI
jgi:hypothetical protein